MSLFERAPFERLILGLPHTEIVVQWGGASVGKVGPKGAGKIFALLSDWSSARPALSFKCSEMSFMLLADMAGVRPAPYLARAKWVQVSDEAALSEDELAAYVTEAHRLIAAKLPKRLRMADRT